MLKVTTHKKYNVSAALSLLLAAVMTIGCAVASTGCTVAPTPDAPGNIPLDMQTPASEQTSAMEGYRSQYNPAHIGSMEAFDLVASNQNAVVLDVRSEASYLERHVAIAVNVPYESIADYSVDNLPDKDAVIICYCFCDDKGGPALSAVNLLADLGYTNVFYTEPGEEWTYGGTEEQNATGQEPDTHRIITGIEAKAIIDSAATAILLDVRNQNEYDAGHIKDSILIPVAELESRLSELPDKDVIIIVFCGAGVRSAKAYGILIANGYVNVFDMQGIGNWPGELQS